jgi:hypothetical protein
MSLVLFPECLRGWLDYPGHSVLFSRPLRGVPWDFSCGYPIGISFQDLSVASLETSHVDTRLAFLFKTLRGVPRVLRRFYLATLLWIPVGHFSSRPTVVSLDTRLAFLLKTFCGVPRVHRRFISPHSCGYPTGISSIFLLDFRAVMSRPILPICYCYTLTIYAFMIFCILILITTQV